MAQVRLLLDDSLLDRVDRARSKQPRLSWIRDAIEEKLDRPVQSKPREPGVIDHAPPPASKDPFCRHGVPRGRMCLDCAKERM